MLNPSTWRPARLPKDMKPQLLVAVDTEEEFDWSKPHNRHSTGVQSIRTQERAHKVFEKYGLKPRARIKATAKIGTDPTIMLTGPVPVTEKILKDSGMAISDIDLFEVNEAFAAVVLRFMQAFDVDASKVNVNGGAIAMGHPLGATGAMILGTVLDELERTGKSTALVTLCIGAGMGTATIIERV